MSPGINDLCCCRRKEQSPSLVRSIFVKLVMPQFGHMFIVPFMNRLFLEFHPLSNKTMGLDWSLSNCPDLPKPQKWAQNVGTFNKCWYVFHKKCGKFHRFSKIMATPLTTNCFLPRITIIKVLDDCNPTGEQ